MLHPYIDGYMSKEADWKERLTEVAADHPAAAGATLGGAFGTSVGLLPDDKVDTVKDKLKNILIYGTAGAGAGAVGGAIGSELRKRKPISVDFDQLNRDQQIKYLRLMQAINTGKLLNKAFPGARDLVR